VNCGSDNKIPKFPFQPKVFHDLINPITEQFLVIERVQVCNPHCNVSACSDVLKCSSRGYKPRPAAGRLGTRKIEANHIMSIGLFIDGAYVLKTFKNGKLDYTKLRSRIERDLSDVVTVGYFFNADREPPKAKALHSALEQPYPNGPGLRTKIYWLKEETLHWPRQYGGEEVRHPDKGKYPDLSYVQTTQKAVDVGLAYHMIRSYHIDKWEKLVLATGDADFAEPVQDLVEHYGVKLYLVGSSSNISNSLVSYAKQIFEIDKEPLSTEIVLLT
jgi:uncharacterized LabA/DUF88 family protein